MASFIYVCGAVIFYPCEEKFDYTVQLCGSSCYQFQPFMGLFDVVLTVFVPIFFITLFNIVLILRVFYHKRRMQQKNIWKKNVSMLVQLLAIVLLYVLVWLPTCIVLIISLVQVPAPQLILELQYAWVLLNLLYIGVLGSPFTSIVALPELKEKVTKLIRRLRGQLSVNQVVPVSRTAN